MSDYKNKPNPEDFEIVVNASNRNEAMKRAEMDLSRGGKKINALEFSKVVKEECTYDGNTWTFVFKEGELSWAQYLESFMRLGAFGNKPLNENVYFYRLINIIKKELPDIIFESMLKHFKNSDDENLRGNIKEYISYQSKIDQIEKFVSENEIQVSEHWDRT